MMRSIHNTHEFDKNNCYVAALASMSVYDDEKINRLARSFDMSCKIYNVNNHRAAILHRFDFAIIAYCGTNDFQDFITDVKYRQRQLPRLSAMVHIGVDSAYNQLALKMAGDIRKIMVSSNNWMITGHSLGGGLAVRSLVGLKNPNGCCYTFGAMRVGNKAMFTSINVPIIRVVNGNDLVPHLPFKKMVLSGYEYCHRQQKLINLNYDYTITEGNRSLWGSAKERISGIYGDVVDLDFIPDNIEDHSIDDYVRILAQWEGQ